MTYIEWGALGLLLVLLELFIPGIYLIWFGFAGITLSTVIYYDLLPYQGLSAELIAFSVLSVIYALIGMYVYKKIQQRSLGDEKYKNLNDLASQYLGEKCVLTQATVDGKTKVKVADTVWLAETDENLEKGEIATIVAVKKGLIFVISTKK